MPENYTNDYMIAAHHRDKPVGGSRRAMAGQYRVEQSVRIHVGLLFHLLGTYQP